MKQTLAMLFWTNMSLLFTQIIKNISKAFIEGCNLARQKVKKTQH
jgi:hypothetical protein